MRKLVCLSIACLLASCAASVSHDDAEESRILKLVKEFCELQTSGPWLDNDESGARDRLAEISRIPISLGDSFLVVSSLQFGDVSLSEEGAEVPVEIEVDGLIGGYSFYEPDPDSENSIVANMKSRRTHIFKLSKRSGHWRIESDYPNIVSRSAALAHFQKLGASQSLDANDPIRQEIQETVQRLQSLIESSEI